MVFYLGWAQGFPRKIFCVHYFSLYLPTAVSRSVSKINQTDCSRKFDKNTIHFPLVSCTLKSTVLMPIAANTIALGEPVHRNKGAQQTYLLLVFFFIFLFGGRGALEDLEKILCQGRSSSKYYNFPIKHKGLLAKGNCYILSYFSFRDACNDILH